MYGITNAFKVPFLINLLGYNCIPFRTSLRSGTDPSKMVRCLYMIFSPRVVKTPLDGYRRSDSISSKSKIVYQISTPQPSFSLNFLMEEGRFYQGPLAKTITLN